MECPVCEKPTRHRTAIPVVGISRAVLADGTCDKCWRTKMKMQRRRPGGAIMSDDEAAQASREALEAYLNERRRRGIEPEGNKALDEVFEHDHAWKQAEKIRIKEEIAERRRNNEPLGLQQISDPGRRKVPALRDNGNTRSTAQAKPGHGRIGGGFNS